MYGKQLGNETVDHAACGCMTNSFGIIDEARYGGGARLAIAVELRNGRE